MDEIFQVFESRFERFKTRKNVEMEFRLGKMCSRGTFNTDVGKEPWEKIHKALEKYSGWDSVKKSISTVYSVKDKRIIVDDITAERNSHTKKKLFQKDFRMDTQKSYDVRLSIAQETPTDHEEEMEDVRKRSRTSFIRKNLSIDMTIVDGHEDPDNEDPNSYHIEFEIIDPGQVSDKHALYNMVYKIECVLNVLK